LQDQARITPVDYDLSQPAYPAQSVIRREKKLSLSYFTPKAGLFWLSAGRRSPRLEPTFAGSQLLQDHTGLTSVDFDLSKPADLAQSALRREKKLSLNHLPQKPVCSGGLLV
jgi:hypothetical protein